MLRPLTLVLCGEPSERGGNRRLARIIERPDRGQIPTSEVGNSPSQRPREQPCSRHRKSLNGARGERDDRLLESRVLAFDGRSTPQLPFPPPHHYLLVGCLSLIFSSFPFLLQVGCWPSVAQQSLVGILKREDIRLTERRREKSGDLELGVRCMYLPPALTMHHRPGVGRLFGPNMPSGSQSF
ncbi:hypothetical protein CH63R_09858 [Colletotrichum higginsianum IMI 349063]|uniref:Uncharacterized protein n=1 Tax=Colletotrichum higginsianum (strain IMI 349063) TaxID=759273 RepID=A0A1B7Y153_COLHI|nr:uncharacterized protein CH63R_09858 [Colletotrichum higginsianum IMI 349063]OBR05738.1 hypothetical protein CH63R_09858 [Colletotrichum higginsianum IMI 349063]